MGENDQKNNQETRVVYAAGFSWIDFGPSVTQEAFMESPPYALFKSLRALVAPGYAWAKSLARTRQSA